MKISVLDKHWFVLYCSPHIARSFWSDLSFVQHWPNFRWDRKFPVPSPSGLGVGMENKNVGRRDGNWGNLEYWEWAFPCVRTFLQPVLSEYCTVSYVSSLVEA